MSVPTFLNGVTVMLADDAPNQRNRNEAVCLKYGMKVLGSYEDGAALVADYPRLKPRVVLLDMQMLQMHGTEAAQAIRATGIPTKIILVTSMGQQSISNPAQVGADYLLVKPFPDEWFLAAILSVLENEPIAGGDQPSVADKLPIQAQELPPPVFGDLV